MHPEIRRSAASVASFSFPSPSLSPWHRPHLPGKVRPTRPRIKAWCDVMASANDEHFDNKPRTSDPPLLLLRLNVYHTVISRTGSAATASARPPHQIPP